MTSKYRKRLWMDKRTFEHHNRYKALGKREVTIIVHALMPGNNILIFFSVPQL